jgi:hypothetical protein
LLEPDVVRVFSLSSKLCLEERAGERRPFEFGMQNPEFRIPHFAFRVPHLETLLSLTLSPLRGERELSTALM